MKEQSCDACGVAPAVMEIPDFTEDYQICVCSPCADKIKLVRATHRLNDAVEAIFREVNGGDAYSRAAFINLVRYEHRTLQQSFMRWICELIATYANLKPGEFDLRLEDTVNLCRKLNKVIKDDGGLRFI